jgi:hypothetical protein
MRGEQAGFERLLSVMPEGWEDKAKELGALTRGREIKSTFDLLRLVFLYLTEGKSFSGTAVLLTLTGVCSIDLFNNTLNQSVIIYKWNEVERMFRRLKGFRRIRRRYDKVDLMFSVYIYLALCVIAVCSLIIRSVNTP